MKFWINAGFLEVGQLVPVAQAAERLGYEGVTMPDHLVHPEHIESSYPYSTDGRIGWRSDAPWPDCWVAIAAMAQGTERIRFGTSVFVGPLRDAVTIAKAVGTCAAFAPGRIMCGLGAGWMREEFEAVGQDFASRGRRLDEIIDVLPKLWSGEAVAHAGDQIAFPTLRMRPAAGRVPILVGGNTRPALRRAANADGWIAAFTTIEELTAMMSELGAQRERQGTDRRSSEVLVTAMPDVVEHSDALDRLGVDGVVIPAIALAASSATDDVVAAMELYASTADIQPTKS